MTSGVSAKEIAFAQSLLGYLHSPNADNVYLLLAVVAWLRQESGGLSRVIGNNPFNIRTSPYAIGYRTAGRNGHFALFASLDIGAKATAALLLSDGAHGWRGYGLIVAAADRGVANTTAAKQQQAEDFLNAIALSKWDAAHYGTSGTVSGFDQNANHLIQVWARMLGLPVTIPAKVTPPVKVKPQPKPAPPVRALQPPPPKRQYTSASAVRTFYEERHPTTGDPLNDEPRRDAW